MRLSTILKHLSLALFVVAFVAACGGKKDGGGKGNAAQAIKDAEAAMAIAAKNKWEWRDTKKILKKAKEAKKKGDKKLAVKLANKAKSQAELAVKQYNAEKGMDRSKYIQ